MKILACDHPVAVITPDYIDLSEPLDVEYVKNGRVLALRVPAGVRSDFGSVPWFVRWLISRTDRELMIASIVHDYLCGQYNRPPAGWDWRDAAEMMVALMEFHKRRKGVAWWSRLKRHLCYRGVMLNGIIHGKASV